MGFSLTPFDTYLATAKIDTSSFSMLEFSLDRKYRSSNANPVNGNLTFIRLDFSSPNSYDTLTINVGAGNIFHHYDVLLENRTQNDSWMMFEFRGYLWAMFHSTAASQGFLGKGKIKIKKLDRLTGALIADSVLAIDPVFPTSLSSPAEFARRRTFTIFRGVPSVIELRVSNPDSNNPQNHTITIVAYDFYGNERTLDTQHGFFTYPARDGVTARQSGTESAMYSYGTFGCQIKLYDADASGIDGLVYSKIFTDYGFVNDYILYPDAKDFLIYNTSTGGALSTAAISANGFNTTPNSIRAADEINGLKTYVLGATDDPVPLVFNGNIASPIINNKFDQFSRLINSPSTGLGSIGVNHVAAIAFNTYALAFDFDIGIDHYVGLYISAKIGDDPIFSVHNYTFLIGVTYGK